MANPWCGWDVPADVIPALFEPAPRVADPARLDVRGTLVCGQDVEIDINAIFEGHVTLGDGVKVGANCVIPTR